MRRRSATTHHSRRHKLVSPIISDRSQFNKMMVEQMNRMMMAIGYDYLPSVEMMNENQVLAFGLLDHNQSEFLFGIDQPEILTELDEEVSLLRRWDARSGERVAKVWLDENKGVLCARFPYQVEVIQQIKERIPSGKKVWNPDDKIWEFSCECIDEILAIMHEGFEKVIDLTKETPMIPTSSTDQLLSLLDEEDISKIQRMLSLKYHPDRPTGGDGRKMAKINEIITKAKG